MPATHEWRRQRQLVPAAIRQRTHHPVRDLVGRIGIGREVQHQRRAGQQQVRRPPRPPGSATARRRRPASASAACRAVHHRTPAAARPARTPCPDRSRWRSPRPATRPRKHPAGPVRPVDCASVPAARHRPGPAPPTSNASSSRGMRSSHRISRASSASLPARRHGSSQPARPGSSESSASSSERQHQPARRARFIKARAPASRAACAPAPVHAPAAAGTPQAQAPSGYSMTVEARQRAQHAGGRPPRCAARGPAHKALPRSSSLRPLPAAPASRSKRSAARRPRGQVHRTSGGEDGVEQVSAPGTSSAAPLQPMARTGVADAQRRDRGKLRIHARQQRLAARWLANRRRDLAGDAPDAFPVLHGIHLQHRHAARAAAANAWSRW